MKEIILIVVRWYVSYALNYRNIEKMILERGITVDHSTLNRWVIEYAPQLENEFRKNFKKVVGKSWRMDETYIKIKGKWHYLYRAVDKEEKIVKFMLSKNRDEPAAKAFFTMVIGLSGMPEKITIDKSDANKTGIEAINMQLIVM